MREILFKAKRIDNGEWLEGLVTKIENTFCLIREYGSNISYECDVNTLCQYTGLTDKNGNKIWENDVVDLDYDNFIVKWDKDDARFTLENETLIESFFNIDGKWCEVIGNIFDNAELIGGIDE
jgi:uncharacterized phage protein (TIGR01671 family)